MLNAFIKNITLPLVLLLSSLPTFSLEVGDTIDPEIAKQLNIPAGKVGIIDFFASWCLSCAKEMPELNDFDANESTNQTKVLGIDVDEELEEGLVFQRKFNVKFAVHNDTTQKIIQHFDPIGMPALFYIKDNKVIGKRIGAVDNIDEKIKLDLAKLGVNLL